MPHVGPIVIGNTKIHEWFDGVLKKLPIYVLLYDQVKTEVTLWFQKTRHDRDFPVITFSQVSHETAKRLAFELGLKGDGELAMTWTKDTPYAYLYDDRSPQADSLIADLARSGIAFEIIKEDRFGLRFEGQVELKDPTFEEMRQLIRNMAGALPDTFWE